MKLSKRALPCFDALQELYGKFRISHDDACCCAADFFVWAMMQEFDSKEDVIKSMKLMFPTMIGLVEANWDGFQARREVIAALGNGESGGWLQ